MKLGVIIGLEGRIEDSFAQLEEMGFESCQLRCWRPELYTDENAQRVLELSKKHGIEISALWAGWRGPGVWDFYDGPLTLGLIPREYRAMRCEDLIKGADFAVKIGVTDVVTHVGFIPEVPCSTEYAEVIATLRYIAGYCKDKGRFFLFETGQETPVTLRRAIEDIGTDNLGINLDPANLILYGKASPTDAMEVFGPLVRGVHAKDGFYPTDGKKLGREVPVGDGLVNFPLLISKLKKVGYDGSITIEREISGEQQKKDIISAKSLLEKLIAEE